MDIIYEDKPVNQDYIDFGHILQPSDWSREAGARFEQSWTFAPTSSIGRMLEMEMAEDEDSNFLNPKEYRMSKHYRKGVEFPDGVKESVAKIVADRKDKERIRQDIIERSPGGFFRAGSMLAVDFAAQLADLVNVASAFIPIVGEARFAQMTGRLGITGARAIRGAAEGLAGAAMVEPFVYAATKQEQADYDAYDSLLAVGFGAGFGSVLHVGAGKLGDVLGISPYAQDKMKSKAIADIKDGIPPDLETLVTAGADPTLFRKLGPRDTLYKELISSNKFTDESVNAIFTFMDSISKNSYERGLIDDVNQYYGNILDKTKGKRVIISKDITNFVERTMGKLETQEDIAFYNAHKKDVDRAMADQVSQFDDADGVFEYLSDGLSNLSKALKSADVPEIIKGLFKYLPFSNLSQKETNLMMKTFEKYLMEGKAPKPELEPMFDTFRRALSTVYENVKMQRYMFSNEESVKIKKARDNVNRTSSDINNTIAEINDLHRERAMVQNRMDDVYNRDLSREQIESELTADNNAINKIDNEINRLSDQYKKLSEKISQEEVIYQRERELATTPIEISDEVRELFDRMIVGDDTPPVERVIPKEKLMPKTDDEPMTHGKTKGDRPSPEIKAFTEQVNNTAEEIKSGDRAAYTGYKNLDEELTALKEMIDERRSVGDMTETEHEVMSKLVLEQQESVVKNMDLVDGILNCII